MHIELDPQHARLVEDAVAHGLAPDARGFVQDLIDAQPRPEDLLLLRERLDGPFHEVDPADAGRQSTLLAEVRRRADDLRRETA